MKSIIPTFSVTHNVKKKMHHGNYTEADESEAQSKRWRKIGTGLLISAFLIALLFKAFIIAILMLPALGMILSGKLLDLWLNNHREIFARGVYENIDTITFQAFHIRIQDDGNDPWLCVKDLVHVISINEKKKLPDHIIEIPDDGPLIDEPCVRAKKMLDFLNGFLENNSLSGDQERVFALWIKKEILFPRRKNPSPIYKNTEGGETKIIKPKRAPHHDK